MADLNITKQGEVVKSIKVPNTVFLPLAYGAVAAGIGAIGGMIGGFVVGLWNDMSGLLKK